MMDKGRLWSDLGLIKWRTQWKYLDYTSFVHTCHPNIGIQFMKNPKLMFLSRNLGSEGLLWLASGGRQIQLYLFEKAGSSFYYWTTPQSGGISSLLRICNLPNFRPWLGQSFEKSCHWFSQYKSFIEYIVTHSTQTFCYKRCYLQLWWYYIMLLYCIDLL